MTDVWVQALLIGLFTGGAIVFVAMAAFAAADVPRISRCTEPGCGARFLDEMGLDMHRAAAHPVHPVLPGE